APRRAQRDHPDRHPDRSRRRHAPGRQRDPHRDCVQHPRRGPPALPGDQRLGSDYDSGHHAVRSVLHRVLQPGRRYRVRVSRSESAVLVSDPLLTVEDLRVQFSTDDGIVHAVDGISYTVEPGQTLGIVGESGSGKTVSSLTTLGLTRASNTKIEGRIMFEGRDLVTLPDDELRKIRGNEIAMIFQDPLSSLHPFFKVGKQLTEAVLTHRKVSRSAARDRAVELLELVGIPDPSRRVDQFPHEFSGGMRQRAMIAMALANE